MNVADKTLGTLISCLIILYLSYRLGGGLSLMFIIMSCSQRPVGNCHISPPQRKMPLRKLDSTTFFHKSLVTWRKERINMMCVRDQPSLLPIRFSSADRAQALCDLGVDG